MNNLFCKNFFNPLYLNVCSELLSFLSCGISRSIAQLVYTRKVAICWHGERKIKFHVRKFRRINDFLYLSVYSKPYYAHLSYSVQLNEKSAAKLRVSISLVYWFCLTGNKVWLSPIVNSLQIYINWASEENSVKI